MLILRFAAGLMAWLTIIAVNVALVGITLYSFSYAGFLGSSELGKVRHLSKLHAHILVRHANSVTRCTWGMKNLRFAFVCAP